MVLPQKKTLSRLEMKITINSASKTSGWAVTTSLGTTRDNSMLWYRKTILQVGSILEVRGPPYVSIIFISVSMTLSDRLKRMLWRQLPPKKASMSTLSTALKTYRNGAKSRLCVIEWAIFSGARIMPTLAAMCRTIATRRTDPWSHKVRLSVPWTRPLQIWVIRIKLMYQTT